MTKVLIIKETWKQIIDYPNYEVSNLGNIRNIKTLKTLKYGLDGSGYPQLGLRKNGEQKIIKVHRIVAIHFLEKKKERKEVNHINRIKTDNRVENLEWCTRRENCCHLFKSINKERFIGVSFCKQTKKWRASIFFEGKLKTIGRFNIKSEARQARVEFEKSHNISNKYL